MRVSLGRVTGYTPTEQQKLHQATEVLGKVLNSKEFRDALLSSTYDGRPGFADETKSPQEVYATIRAAQERYEASPDGEVDLNVHLKSFSFFQRSVVGWPNCPVSNSTPPAASSSAGRTCPSPSARKTRLATAMR